MKHTRNVIMLLLLCHSLAKAQWTSINRSNPYGNIYGTYLPGFQQITSYGYPDSDCATWSATNGTPLELTFEFDENGQRIWRYLELRIISLSPKVAKKDKQFASISKNEIKDDDLVDSNLKVYPNPTPGDVQVEQNNVQQGSTLELYDSSGKRLMQQTMQNHQTLSTSNFPSGSYLLIIKSGDKNALWKIQKI
jgi:Secretion system C-terminal sorting domain